MHLKSTPIFLLIIVISLSLFSNVYAYTDAEITNMYRGADDNQTLDNIDLALHSGSLHCSDLPSNLIMGFCQNQTNSTPQPQQTTSTQTSSSSGLILIPILMIVPIALILIMKTIIGGDGIHMPKVFLKPKTKPSKANVKQYATYIKEDDSGVDMSTLDHSAGIDQIISNHDYFERIKHGTRDSKIQLSTSHKLLLSLGLMKVKKK